MKPTTKILFTIRPGLFIKFFEKKKSLKKKKIIHFLMIKYAKKILTFSGILTFFLLIKQFPPF
jgi:hypothetical protein